MDLKHRLMTTTIKAPCFYYSYADIHHTLKPDAAELIKQAEKYIEQQAIPQATECYKKALEKNGSSPFLTLNYGTILAEQGLVNEGIEELRSIADQNQVGSSAACYNIGTVLLGHRMLKPALEYLEKAYELDPRNVNISNNLGLASLYAKHEDKARYYFLKTLDERPDYEYGAHNLGCIAYEHDDFVKAIEWFEKARTINPANFATLNNLACALFLNDQAKQALPLLYECIKNNPYYRMPYYNLGFIVYEKKLLDIAQA